MRRAPRPDAPLDTEALFGETVKVFDEDEGWAWVQLVQDRYVGYVPSEALSANIVTTSHRVSAPATFVFPAADIKTPPLLQLPLNAEVSVSGEDGRFFRLSSGGYVVKVHLDDKDSCALDFVVIAETFLGTPYLWGGKTRLGLDCSGLVQVVLQAAGIEVPRDSDMQAAELGVALPAGADLSGLQRGDLVCWKGHIGMMTDDRTLLHANAHHMMVAREPLARALERTRAASAQFIGFRRLGGA